MFESVSDPQFSEICDLMAERDRLLEQRDALLSELRALILACCTDSRCATATRNEVPKSPHWTQLETARALVAHVEAQPSTLPTKSSTQAEAQ